MKGSKINSKACALITTEAAIATNPASALQVAANMCLMYILWLSQVIATDITAQGSKINNSEASAPVAAEIGIAIQNHMVTLQAAAARATLWIALATASTVKPEGKTNNIHDVNAPVMTNSVIGANHRTTITTHRALLFRACICFIEISVSGL
jgi:hypothetical protein